MVAMVRYSSQAGCQAQHAIGSPTVCYLCLSRFLSSLYVSIPLFVRLSFAASYSPLRLVSTRAAPPAFRRCHAGLSRAILETEGVRLRRLDSTRRPTMRTEEKFLARGQAWETEKREMEKRD